MTPASGLVYRSYRLVSSLRYWIQQRMTVAGMTVLGAFMVTGTMAVDTENNVSYQAFTLLFFILMVSSIFGWRFRFPFSAFRILPQYGTVGVPLRYLVRIRNLSTRRQKGLTLIERLADPRPSFPQWQIIQAATKRRAKSFRLYPAGQPRQFQSAVLKPMPVPTAPAGRFVDVTMELLPLRRGVLRFEAISLARPDPLGLIRASTSLPLVETALILPRRYSVPPSLLPGVHKYQDGGVTFASRVGQSDEFVALRDYRNGDALRHIHWRSWAKTSKPVVKEFEDEFFVRHALVLDTFTDNPAAQAFEEAVSIAASFACTLQTQESLLDLLFVGPQSYCFTAGRGLAHGDQMLEVLASVQICPNEAFSTLERLVLGHVATVSGIVCVLIDWDEQRQEFIRKLRMVGLPLLVILIVGPGEDTSPPAGPMADDPANFHVLETGRIEQGLARLRSAAPTISVTQ
jgi:uncharacterized protein (DUF58 family)